MTATLTSANTTARTTPCVTRRRHASARPPRPPTPADSDTAQQTVLRRRRLNDTARAHHHGVLHVVLYAIARPDQDPYGDLATCQGHATLHGLVVIDRITDTAATDDPTGRRGYARLLRRLADPTTPVHGVVATERDSITPIDRLYNDQLTWYAAHHAGLWLIQPEANL